MYNFLLGLFNWDKYIEQLRQDCGLNDSKDRIIVPWTDEINRLIFENSTKH